MISNVTMLHFLHFNQFIERSINPLFNKECAFNFAISYLNSGTAIMDQIAEI